MELHHEVSSAIQALGGMPIRGGLLPEYREYFKAHARARFFDSQKEPLLIGYFTHRERAVEAVAQVRALTEGRAFGIVES